MRGLVCSVAWLVLMTSCMSSYGLYGSGHQTTSRNEIIARKMAMRQGRQQRVVLQEFYYYPAAEVYFNTKDKIYMFFKDGTWMYDVKPPESIVSLDLYVSIADEANTPWVRHENFKSKYPRDHFKDHPKFKKR